MKRRAFTPLDRRSKSDDYRYLTGFTLIEIMVVVGIFIILVTLITPSILRSRIVANEAAAISNLKTIHGACQMYYINEGTYPPDLNTLSNSTPSYIDPELGAGRRQGYEFVYAFIDIDHFTINANPVSIGLLKGRYFYTDESGIVRANPEGIAGPNDGVVQ